MGREEVGGSEGGVAIREEIPGLQVRPQNGSLEKLGDSRGRGESLHTLPGFGERPGAWSG